MIESKIRDGASFDFRHGVRSRAGLEIGIAERKVVIERHAVAPAFMLRRNVVVPAFGVKLVLAVLGFVVVRRGSKPADHRDEPSNGPRRRRRASW